MTLDRALYLYSKVNGSRDSDGTDSLITFSNNKGSKGNKVVNKSRKPKVTNRHKPGPKPKAKTTHKSNSNKGKRKSKIFNLKDIQNRANRLVSQLSNTLNIVKGIKHNKAIKERKALTRRVVRSAGRALGNVALGAGSGYLISRAIASGIKKGIGR